MSAILAAFDTEAALLEALRKLRAEQVGELQTYTPKVLEGEPTGSPLPLIIFVAGLAGAVCGVRAHDLRGCLELSSGHWRASEILLAFFRPDRLRGRRAVGAHGRILRLLRGQPDADAL